MSRTWQLPDRSWEPIELPRLMGILNVTPDSFSDGGAHNEVAAAVEHGLKIVDNGADIIDVGGESTRPGSEPVSVDEELKRTVPVIQALSEQTDVPISIDTTKAKVAVEAIAAGAMIVNDISGLTFDVEMISVCADSDAAIVCMHIQGTPQTMQQEPHYEDCTGEVSAFLNSRLEAMSAVGIDPVRVCLDPGIGFGKTADHNLQLLRNIATLHELQRPLLIGHSRKRFLSKLLGRPVEERLAGTVGVSIALAQAGADYIRIHDVQAVRDALLAWRAIGGA
ncbi:MAG: dihydropteroate synthase [Planctomycetaceae bacterium]